jgi:hypothetical protein
MVTTKSRKLTALALLLAAVFITAGAYEAEAVTALYGTFGKGEYSTSTLVEINQNTGEIIRFIGQVGFTVNGLAWDPTTGKLYASTSTQDPSYNGLIEIDLATGAGTQIGVDGWGFGSAAITNITVNSSGQMYGWTENGDDLVSINKATGIATVIGNSGIGTWANGLAFNIYGTLFMINGDGRCYIMNTSSGASSYYGDIEPGVGKPLHHGVFHPDTNLYYGIRHTPDPDPWDESATNLLTSDISSESVASSVPTAFDLHTLAFVDLPGLVDLDLEYDDVDNEMTVTITVGNEVPTMMQIRLFIWNKVYLLGSVPLAPTDPPGTESFTVSFPPVGEVGVLITLLTQDGGIAHSVWKTVDTGF